MNNTQAVKVFNALSQELRLSIMLDIIKCGHGGTCPCQILERFDISNAGLTFHLKELESAGLISPFKKGKFIYYKPNCEVLKELGDFLTAECKCLTKGGKAKTCATKKTPVKKTKPVIKKKTK